MLDRDSWYPRTIAGIDCGRKARRDHTCGSGHTLLVSHRTDGSFSAWCFRCNDGDGVSAPKPSLAELVRLAEVGRKADAVHAGVSSGPEPANHDVDSWPIGARLWLYGAGLGKSEIANLGAYFHHPTQRVVLPVTVGRQGGGSEVVYWQARSIDGRKPKYLGADCDKSKVIAAYGTELQPGVRETGEGCAQHLRSVATQGVVALTEDILSAFKVGLQCRSYSLLGTALSDGLAAHLSGLPNVHQVLVWLDPDDAGRRAATRVRRRLSLLGLTCKIINSRDDPKRLTHSEIADVLGAAVADT